MRIFSAFFMHFLMPIWCIFSCHFMRFKQAFFGISVDVMRIKKCRVNANEKESKNADKIRMIQCLKKALIAFF